MHRSKTVPSSEDRSYIVAEVVATGETIRSESFRRTPGPCRNWRRRWRTPSDDVAHRLAPDRARSLKRPKTAGLPQDGWGQDRSGLQTLHLKITSEHKLE